MVKDARRHTYGIILLARTSPALRGITCSVYTYHAGSAQGNVLPNAFPIVVVDGNSCLKSEDLEQQDVDFGRSEIFTQARASYTGEGFR